MLYDLLLIAIGIVLGWFFLPTPQWAKDLISKIPFLGAYMK
jgi:hypothetical protein